MYIHTIMAQFIYMFSGRAKCSNLKLSLALAQMPWNGACIYPSLHSSYFNCLKIFNLTNWHTTSRALVFHKVGLNWDNSVIGNSKRHSKKPKTFGTFFLVDSPSPEVWSMLGHLPNLKYYYTAIQIHTNACFPWSSTMPGWFNSPCKHEN